MEADIESKISDLLDMAAEMLKPCASPPKTDHRHTDAAAACVEHAEQVRLSHGSDVVHSGDVGVQEHYLANFCCQRSTHDALLRFDTQTFVVARDNSLRLLPGCTSRRLTLRAGIRPAMLRTRPWATVAFAASTRHQRWGRRWNTVCAATRWTSVLPGSRRLVSGSCTGTAATA